MQLKERIVAELTASMKAREELKTSTLRMLKAEIMKFEVSGANKEATDDVVIDIVKRSIKQRKEAAEGFLKGGNQTAAQKEMDESKILEIYMPEQLSEDKIRSVIKETISEMNPGPADFGKVMSASMGKLKGKADGNVVGRIVKELLQ